MSNWAEVPKAFHILRASKEKGKELESTLDELIKSMKVFQLRFAKLDNVESLSQQKSKEG